MPFACIDQFDSVQVDCFFTLQKEHASRDCICLLVVMDSNRTCKICITLQYVLLHAARDPKQMLVHVLKKYHAPAEFLVNQLRLHLAFA